VSQELEKTISKFGDTLIIKDYEIADYQKAIKNLQNKQISTFSIKGLLLEIINRIYI